MCDFERDCSDGEDEAFTNCGVPQSFEKNSGLEPWKNDDDADYEFTYYNELKFKDKYAPDVDGANNPMGRNHSSTVFLHLDEC